MSTANWATPGTLVNLKTDKNKAVWEIKETRDNGTIEIARHRRPQTIYTTMYVTESRLQKVEAQRVAQR